MRAVLTGHVGAGDDDDLLRLGVQPDVVGHVSLADGQLLFDDGMAALVYLQDIIVGYDGTDVAVCLRHGGKGQEAVQPCQLGGVYLHGRDVFDERLYQVVEELRLEHQDFVFRTQDFFLIFLQFLRDVAFGIGQGLLAYPLGRDFVLVRVAHLDVVAEDVVVAYFQAGDAGLFTFALLDLQEIVFAGVGDAAQFVQFGVESGADDAALVDQQRRVVVQLVVDAVAHGLAQVKLLAHAVEAGIVCLEAGGLDRFDGLQGHFQRHHFARGNAADRYFGEDAFEVAHTVQLLFDELAEVGVSEEILHGIQAFVDGLDFFQGKDQPAFQQAGTHGADGAVDDAEQAAASVVHGIHQLEAAHGELIQADIFVGLDAGQRSDVAYLRVLRQDEVLQDGTRSDDAVGEVFYPKSFEVFHFEVLQQLLAGGGFGENPVIQFIGEELAAEVPFEHRALAPLEQHFLGGEVVQQLVHIVGLTLRSQKFTGRYVQESHSANVALAEVHGCQEVVFLVVQHIVVDRDTGGHQFSNASLHQLLGQFGVFQLVADGYTLAGPDQLGQVGVQGMVRKSGHLDGLPSFAVVAFGQGNAQDVGGHYGVGRIGFVEIPATEKHDGIGMLGLQVEKLLHHGGEDNIWIHGHVSCF